MRLPDRLAVRYRRTTVIYLAAIVLPTMVLLAFGLHSLRRQTEAYQAVRLANARLSLERTAERFEREVERLAALALRDPEAATVLSLLAEPSGPANQRRLRRVLAGMAGRHPIVQQFFVFEGERLRFPRVSEALPGDWRDTLAGMPEPRRSRVFAALEKAEAIDATGRASLAAQAYLRCADLAVPSELRALARLRAAGALRIAGNTAAALRLLRILRDEHQDDYDLFHRPYALVASLELAALDGMPAPVQSRVAEDVAAGRWELSAEQATYFLTRLGAGAGRRGEFEGHAFLRELDLARVLHESVRPRAVSDSEIAAGAVSSSRPLAYYYTGLSSSPARSGNAPDSRLSVSQEAPVLGLVVDGPWAARAFLRRGGDVDADAPKMIPATGRVAEEPRTVRLQAPFTGFVLVAPSEAGATSGGLRDVLVIVAGTLGVLSVLLLGVVLLVRDAARETQHARMRSDFVSGVSHQVRTPLTLIRLYGEMLAEADDLPAAQRTAHLDVITGESRRLTALVERVLDFSRVERGQKPYLLQPGDLVAGVHPVLEVYLPYLRRLGFTTDVALAANLPVVRFDPAAVADALVNLLDNAMKYSTERRHVTVRLHRVPAGVALEVEDEGVGIPIEERSRLFEPFRRGAALAEKGGYGLGLFLVRDMMMAHGGAIDVESRVGAGSLFRLTFPVEPGADS